MASILEQFKQHAAIHGVSTEEGNSDGANVSYELLQKVYFELMNTGNPETLLTLFDDPNPWVQLCAAGHALEIDEPSALTKLGQLETENIPLISTSAKYTILGWKAGQLRFIPPK
jgi:hypothetical protein